MAKSKKTKGPTITYNMLCRQQNKLAKRAPQKPEMLRKGK
jgi:hypothetical protein